MGEAIRRGDKPMRIAAAMEAKGVKFELLIIYKSDNPEGPWTPVHSDDVPDWLKTNLVAMGRLMDRRTSCTNESIPNCPWYRAEPGKIPSGVIIQ